MIHAMASPVPYQEKSAKEVFANVALRLPVRASQLNNVGYFSLFRPEIMEDLLVLPLDS